MKVLDIIKRSLRMLSVIAAKETPDAESTNDCMSVLNMMLDQWSNEKLMLYVYESKEMPVVANQQQYQIGPSVTSDWIMTRPLRIEKAVMRLTGSAPFPIDMPIEQITSEQWQGIYQKTMPSAFPCYFRYLQNYPDGLIDIYPIPTQALTFCFLCWQQLTKFTSLTDDIDLPPGYESALCYNLAVQMAPEYGFDVTSDIRYQAKDTKMNLMRVNHEPTYMTSDLAMSTGHYNIYTDSYRK